MPGAGDTLRHERVKYERCWADPRYREYSPGEAMLPLFRRMVRRREGKLLDLGCGTRRAGQALHKLGFEVQLADLVPGCLDPGVRLPFRKLNVWGQWPTYDYDWVYCCDVMEHLPPEKVDRSLGNIARHTRQAFFSIHFGPDVFGDGHLHLTVRPFTWWRDKLAEYGEVTDARDLIGMGVFRLRA